MVVDMFVHQNDCINHIKQMADEVIDLTITSPPYDDLRFYGGNKPPTIDYKTLASELLRATKPGGVCVWIVADQTKKGSETLSSFRQAILFQEAGWNVHDTMIWHKDTATMPDRTRYNQVFEYMFVFSKGKPKTFSPIEDRRNKWAGTKVHGTYRNAQGEPVKRGGSWSEKVISEFGKRNNVWGIPGEKSNKTGHPAVFPERLVHDHLVSWSNAGDLVFDPFTGSGTTGVVAVREGRKFQGVELNPEYARLADERVEAEIILR